MKKLTMLVSLFALTFFSQVSLADNHGHSDPVKIGFLTTLSGGAGYLGRDARDGFLLAMSDGKLGGVDVELIVEDDEAKPDIAKRTVDRMLSRDRIDILTGIIFSHVANATAPSVLAKGKFYISPNAGPSNFAGESCHENYFVASWQNDNLHEAAGELANSLGYENTIVVSANYPAGRDAATGFKRQFKGNIAEEIYPKFGQTDYAAELAKIKNTDADSIFLFIPGGPGIAFTKQYAQAGISDSKPIVTSFVNTDNTIIQAIGDAIIGVQSATHWNQDFNIPSSQEFVANFKEAYDRVPTVYASQGYDTALLIASALKETGGQVSSDSDEFRSALKSADFDAVRGSFEFGNNNHPVQDWYGRIVKKAEDGSLYNETTDKILSDHQDVHAASCSL